MVLEAWRMQYKEREDGWIFVHLQDMLCGLTFIQKHRKQSSL